METLNLLGLSLSSKLCSPTTLVQTLNWQTLERRRTIKQAMTFYKILNNIIEINPPTGLLTRRRTIKQAMTFYKILNNIIEINPPTGLLTRRRTIKQAMTFYKILNNIIEINPPTGLLTRSHTRHHFTIPRSRLNSVVYSFYPRAIRIWNTIPKEITEIKQPESFHAAISKLPFTTPTHLKCL